MLSLVRLDQIVAQSDELEKSLADALDRKDIVRFSRAYAEIGGVVRHIRDYRRLLAERDAAQELLEDPDMHDMAVAELESLAARIEKAEAGIRAELAPVDVLDTRPAVLEIRAGAGGREAALFVSDLLRMYERYAQVRGWTFDIVDERATELGGSRESVATVRGKGVFARLKHEAGVHRVQRVPETESQGRIHTSTATVAVLPEPDEVEIEIRDEDLRIDTMRASGAGGQHVNKTDSAVRITHLPTGMAVISSEKSQHRNRVRAMAVLRARLFMERQTESDAARADDRRGQVGTGDRSERIRTYNFPQGRVTDHRIGFTLHNLPAVLDGELDPIVEELMRAESDVGDGE